MSKDRKKQRKMCADCGMDFYTRRKQQSICYSCEAEYEQKVFDRANEDNLKGGENNVR